MALKRHHTNDHARRLRETEITKASDNLTNHNLLSASEDF